MSPTSVPLHKMKTERLVLRPTRPADADRAVEIQADWEVTRMLRMASFPPDRQEIGQWFMDHPREWSTGEAYRFAVELEAQMIGMVDIDEIANHQGSLGYWFDRSAWGQGYAFEAAHAVTRFAFAEAGLLKLESGHAHDNQASGRVLTKLGFSPLDIVPCFSRSRGKNIMQHRYELTSASR